VDVRYERGDAVVSRVLDPLGLVLKGGTWYLVARSKGDVRTYRVSRVRRVSLRDELFERPDDFDLAAHWASAAAGFEAVRNRVEVEARVTPFALGRIGEVLEPGSARAALESAEGPDVEGWTTVRFMVEHVDYAHDMLLRLGAGIEVLAPPALRARLASTANALADQYAM
jgi:predicted DNA-binding transcriptional regulator YafY